MMLQDWDAERIAAHAGARLAAPPPACAGPPGPARVVVDSREAGPGDLFVGLPGARTDGGRFAAGALAAGAWGVLVAPEHADAARCARPGALLAAPDPLAALGRLARAWRRELGCAVVGITGSTGKTSTKDVLAAMLAPHRRVVATAENLNTEIGLPLVVLGAPAGTEVLVLEMAMRGRGQIAELAAIAEPDVGVITNIGPVHLELLGTLEAIAATKAELIAGLRPSGTAVVPVGEALLDGHRRDDIRRVTFGAGGDVAELPAGLRLPFTSAHMRLNALAALAAARAVGVEPAGEIDVRLSRLRGQRRELPSGIVVVDDCYNANPMSMLAALDDLAASGPGRKVAALGDLLARGPPAGRYHAEIGEHARRAGVDVLVTVGGLAAGMGAGWPHGAVRAVPDARAAAELVPRLARPGDTILVKASRGVGLEVVGEALAGAES